MPTPLTAILYLKAVLDNENIFHKMDGCSKKRKSISSGGGGLSSKTENR